MCVQNEALNSMRSDIRWIRNRVSSLVDNLTDQRDAAVNTSPQGLSRLRVVLKSDKKSLIITLHWFGLNGET